MLFKYQEIFAKVLKQKEFVNSTIFYKAFSPASPVRMRTTCSKFVTNIERDLGHKTNLTHSAVIQTG